MLQRDALACPRTDARTNYRAIAFVVRKRYACGCENILTRGRNVRVSFVRAISNFTTIPSFEACLQFITYTPVTPVINPFIIYDIE